MKVPVEEFQPNKTYSSLKTSKAYQFNSVVPPSVIQLQKWQLKKKVKIHRRPHTKKPRENHLRALQFPRTVYYGTQNPQPFPISITP